MTGALTLTAGTLDAATNNTNVSAGSLSTGAGAFSGGTGTVSVTGSLSTDRWDLTLAARGRRRSAAPST